MKSRLEKRVVIGRLNGGESTQFQANKRNDITVNMYGYLVVPIENIKGLEDARYMSIQQISEKLDEIGGVVQVDLSGGIVKNETHTK